MQERSSNDSWVVVPSNNGFPYPSSFVLFCWNEVGFAIMALSVDFAGSSTRERSIRSRALNLFYQSLATSRRVASGTDAQAINTTCVFFRARQLKLLWWCLRGWTYLKMIQMKLPNWQRLPRFLAAKRGVALIAYGQSESNLSTNLKTCD